MALNNEQIRALKAVAEVRGELPRWRENMAHLRKLAAFAESAAVVEPIDDAVASVEALIAAVEAETHVEDDRLLDGGDPSQPSPQLAESIAKLMAARSALSELIETLVAMSDAKEGCVDANSHDAADESLQTMVREIDRAQALRAEYRNLIEAAVQRESSMAALQSTCRALDRYDATVLGTSRLLRWLRLVRVVPGVRVGVRALQRARAIAHRLAWADARTELDGLRDALRGPDAALPGD